MNIVVKDKNGIVVISIASFVGVDDPCPIDAACVQDCLFEEDEFWIRDELSYMVEKKLNIKSNYQGDINNARTIFEVTQKDGDSYYVSCE